MNSFPKKLSQQVILITGAGKGVGQALVKMSAKEGCKVFMVDTSVDELQMVHDEMNANNFHTAFTVASVLDIDQLKIAADNCIATFGVIDTWINTSELTVCDSLLSTDENEARKVFDVNFWGVFNACKVAVDSFNRMNNFGVIVNVGNSIVKEECPNQGIYLSSKCAVETYTRVLQKELEIEQVNCSISFVEGDPVKSSYTDRIDGQFGKPSHVPIIYYPEMFAHKILKRNIAPLHTCRSRFVKLKNLKNIFAVKMSDLIKNKYRLKKRYKNRTGFLKRKSNFQLD